MKTFYDEGGAPRSHARTLVDALGDVKGVFRGAAGAELSASVKTTRTDASSPARA